MRIFSHRAKTLVGLILPLVLLAMALPCMVRADYVALNNTANHNGSPEFATYIGAAQDSSGSIGFGAVCTKDGDYIEFDSAASVKVDESGAATAVLHGWADNFLAPHGFVEVIVVVTISSNPKIAASGSPDGAFDIDLRVTDASSGGVLYESGPCANAYGWLYEGK